MTINAIKAGQEECLRLASLIKRFSIRISKGAVATVANELKAGQVQPSDVQTNSAALAKRLTVFVCEESVDPVFSEAASRLVCDANEYICENGIESLEEQCTAIFTKDNVSRIRAAISQVCKQVFGSDQAAKRILRILVDVLEKASLQLSGLPMPYKVMLGAAVQKLNGLKLNGLKMVDSYLEALLPILQESAHPNCPKETARTCNSVFTCEHLAEPSTPKLSDGSNGAWSTALKLADPILAKDEIALLLQDQVSDAWVELKNLLTSIGADPVLLATSECCVYKYIGM